MATSINASVGSGLVTYGKSMITSLLKENLLKVPGVESLVDVASSDDTNELSCFLIYRHAGGIDFQLFLQAIPRTQMIAVAADVRDVVFYAFKHELGINLRRVEIYIEDV